MKRLNILITDWRGAGGLDWVALIAGALDAAVWLKSYDGTRWLDLGEPFAVIAHELQERGVDVGAWGYHYGLEEELALLFDCYYYRHGLEGYEGPRAGLLIDAESEFETGDGRLIAAEQVSRINAAEIPVPVYYTSFAFPFLHPHFPYDKFDRLSGGHVPQVYYNHHGWPDPGDAIVRCVQQHAARGLKLTGAMLPVYDAGPEQGWRPTMDDFLEAAAAMDVCKFPSLWTWTWEQHQWADWSALWQYARLSARLDEQ